VSGNSTVNNLFNREYTQFLNIEPNPVLTVKGGITIKFAEKRDDHSRAGKGA
jgi:hypothetical protein